MSQTFFCFFSEANFFSLSPQSTHRLTTNTHMRVYPGNAWSEHQKSADMQISSIPPPPPDGLSTHIPALAWGEEQEAGMSPKKYKFLLVPVNYGQIAQHADLGRRLEKKITKKKKKNCFSILRQVSLKVRKSIRNNMGSH